MHDPDVVAFEIRRPWPRLERRRDQRRRWGASRFGFLTLAGRRFYFPGMVTVWHCEPGGADSGTVCSHWKEVDGERRRDDSWRWHVQHWRIQVPALQGLRRRLLTRCSWCGGRSGRGPDRVDCSLSWDRETTRWWQGEVDLYHGSCTTALESWRTCTCRTPDLGAVIVPTGVVSKDHGACARCGRFRPWRLSPTRAQRAELVRREVPYGTRPGPEVLAEVRRLVDLEREQQEGVATVGE